MSAREFTMTTALAVAIIALVLAAIEVAVPLSSEPPRGVGGGPRTSVS